MNSLNKNYKKHFWESFQGWYYLTEDWVSIGYEITNDEKGFFFAL